VKGHTDRILAIAFTPDSKRLASGSFDKTARLWNVGSGKELRRYGGDDLIRSLALSPDGKRLAGGTVKGEVRVWDEATGKQLWHGKETDCVTAVAFSPRGESLAAVSRYGIGLWDAGKGKRLNASPEPADGVVRLAYSADGKRLAVAYGT
jgi:WD40 repeat protein